MVLVSTSEDSRIKKGAKKGLVIAVSGANSFGLLQVAFLMLSV